MLWLPDKSAELNTNLLILNQTYVVGTKTVPMAGLHVYGLSDTVTDMFGEIETCLLTFTQLRAGRLTVIVLPGYI